MRRFYYYYIIIYILLTDTQQVPRSLQLDNSSSMESLVSSGSNTSTSAFSKGSSPSVSSGHHRSFFNPAEVDRLPSANILNKVRVRTFKMVGQNALQVKYNQIKFIYSHTCGTSSRNHGWLIGLYRGLPRLKRYYKQSIIEL